jgi:hypothetical protein
MNGNEVEFFFHLVPERHAFHLANKLKSAASAVDPLRKLSVDRPHEIFELLIQNGKSDLLHGEHHAIGDQVPVIVSITEYTVILTDPVNVRATLETTKVKPRELIANVRLLVTHYARHSMANWAIELCRKGLPTCIWINSGDNVRRRQPNRHHRDGLG